MSSWKQTVSSSGMPNSASYSSCHSARTSSSYSLAGRLLRRQSSHLRLRDSNSRNSAASSAVIRWSIVHPCGRLDSFFVGSSLGVVSCKRVAAKLVAHVCGFVAGAFADRGGNSTFLSCSADWQIGFCSTGWGFWITCRQYLMV